MTQDFPVLSPTVRWCSKLALPTSLLLLLGCQSAPQAAFTSAKDGLIGYAKPALLACAGAPVRDNVHGRQTVLLYHRDAPALDQSFFGSKASVGSVHHDCTAVLTLRDDRVVEVEYRPEPSSVAGEDHCEEIFQNCGP